MRKMGKYAGREVGKKRSVLLSKMGRRPWNCQESDKDHSERAMRFGVTE